MKSHVSKARLRGAVRDFPRSASLFPARSAGGMSILRRASAWAVVLGLGLALTSAVVVRSAWADSPEIQVTIAPDSPTSPARTQNGYTVSIANATTRDIAIDQIRFLLPGHGGNPIEQDVYGQPRQSHDVTPGFAYVPGSTTGITSADPTHHERWLTWAGTVIPAGSSATLHFLVTVSDAPAYYVAGATVDAASASVLGTAKGAMVHVLGAGNFSMTMSVDPSTIPLGGIVTYTGEIANRTGQALTVTKVKVALRHGVYITDSTRGALVTNPSTLLAGYLWSEHVAVPPNTTITFSFDVRATSTTKRGSHAVQARAYLSEPLADGQFFAGTGPTAPLKILQPTIMLSSSPSPLPDAAVDEPYAGATLLADGGNTPYTFAVNAGALPPGLTLGSDGALTGTPTQSGSFSFEVTASDRYGATGKATFTLAVAQ